MYETETPSISSSTVVKPMACLTKKLAPIEMRIFGRMSVYVYAVGLLKTNYKKRYSTEGRLCRRIACLSTYLCRCLNEHHLNLGGQSKSLTGPHSSSVNFQLRPILGSSDLAFGAREYGPAPSDHRKRHVIHRHVFLDYAMFGVRSEDSSGATDIRFLPARCCYCTVPRFCRGQKCTP